MTCTGSHTVPFPLGAVPPQDGFSLYGWALRLPSDQKAVQSLFLN